MTTPQTVAVTPGAPPGKVSWVDMIHILRLAGYVLLGWFISDLAVRFVPSIVDKQTQVFLMGGLVIAMKALNQTFTDTRPDKVVGQAPWVTHAIAILGTVAAAALVLPNLPPEPPPAPPATAKQATPPKILPAPAPPSDSEKTTRSLLEGTYRKGAVYESLHTCPWLPGLPVWHSQCPTACLG